MIIAIQQIIRRMIYKVNGCSFALCEDHRVYWWVEGSNSNPQLLINREISRFSSVPRYREYIMLTHDNRVLVGFFGTSKPCNCVPEIGCNLTESVDGHVDITALIYSVLEPGCIDPLIGIHFYQDQLIVVMTAHDIVHVDVVVRSYDPELDNFTLKTKARHVSPYNFRIPCEYDYVTHLLFTTEKDVRCASSNEVTESHLRKPRDMINVIHTVKCGPGSYDLTTEGTINMYRLGATAQLEFAADTFITKIFSKDWYVFFIDSNGECWFLDDTLDGPEPTLLVGLNQGSRRVNNVIATKNYERYIIFERVTYEADIETYDLVYVNRILLGGLANGKKSGEYIIPITIPYTCGTAQIFNAATPLFFVSMEGHVYVYESLDCETPKPIPFFFSNPVAVPREHRAIRSASNTVEH